MNPKIELGKEYPTRNGGKAIVYRDDGVGNFPLIGARNIGDGWRSESWTKDGSYFSERQCHADIILPRIVMVPVEVPQSAVSVRAAADPDGDVHIEFFRHEDTGRVPIEDWIASLGEQS